MLPTSGSESTIFLKDSSTSQQEQSRADASVMADLVRKFNEDFLVQMYISCKIFDELPISFFSRNMNQSVENAVFAVLQFPDQDPDMDDFQNNDFFFLDRYI